MKFSVVLFLRVLLSDVDLNTKLSRLNAKYVALIWPILFFLLWGHIFLHFALTMFMYKRINTQNYFQLKVWVVALQKYHNLCCLLVRCISFNTPLENIVNGDVTLLMKPQNAGLCSPLCVWPLSREGSFLWNNCCDTGPRFLRSRLKVWPIYDKQWGLGSQLYNKR